MTKNIFLIGVVCSLMLFSCKKEDELTPSGADIDYFLPDDSNTSAEADLKRSFFDKTNVRLLFSDTVYVTESDTILIDYDYNYTVNHTGLDYSLERFTNIENQKEAATFVSENILSKMGSIPPPYSVLLAKDFLSVDNSYGYEILTQLGTLISLKTTVINVGDISEKEDWEKKDLEASVLSQYLGNQIMSNYSEDFEDFFEVSSDIYDDWLYMYPTYTETDLVNGFIDFPDYGFTRKLDIISYLYQMLNTSEDDFRATYGDYTRIITKMEAVNKILKEKFDIVIY